MSVDKLFVDHVQQKSRELLLVQLVSHVVNNTLLTCSVLCFPLAPTAFENFCESVFEL